MKTKTENPMHKIHKCSICKEDYIGWGNNAQPYHGRCCDVCNDLFVIPARIAAIYQPRKESPSGSVECPHCHWGFDPSVIDQHIREKH